MNIWNVALFFATVTSEEGERFESCGEAKMALFDFVEQFYNQRRRHSTPGHQSGEFERRAAALAAELTLPRNRINSIPRGLQTCSQLD